MNESVAHLLELLDVRSQGEGLFIGAPGLAPNSRVFGGQLLGQALAAASFSVPPDSACHSLHAYFLRPGKPGRPIDYEVSVMRDGRRLCARKVAAVQRDELVFELTASFEPESPGPEHAEPSLAAPAPESFPDEATRMQQWLEKLPPELHDYVRSSPIEFIELDSRDRHDQTPSAGPVRAWRRVRDRLPDDPALHRCVLAYVSDMGALEPAVRAVGLARSHSDLQLASLDHALWFHRPFRCDEWLLFTVWPVSVGSGRGLCRGLVHSRDGRHVASFTQEALVRTRDPNSD
jgi:acyl-CoA thioesterase II